MAESTKLMTPCHSPSVASTRSLENTPRQQNLAPAPPKGLVDRPPKLTSFGLGSLPLPKPRDPAKCPLFCCFYAEFDNKVGPTICFQSPRHFMDQDIKVPTSRIHEILQETFDSIEEHGPGHQDVDNPNDLGDSSHGSTDKSESSESVLSIFDSCSEYIITGSELTGKVIRLSTHEMHVVTRPTIIHDKAYERNSLLFSVGFILRRSSDPRPFQPIISKWAQALRDLELEATYLSTPTTRKQIQAHLERLLVSLNSRNQECNLQIGPSSVLHLKPFNPPRAPAIPVPDYAVPVLLLSTWRQCQAYYDWDLSIDWCARHIDGVKNARQISEVAEVDMEIVRACLRVLKHHGVIALSDMFFYSNRYEATERAMAMLSGKESDLLTTAIEHAVRVAGEQSSREGSPLLLAAAAYSPGTDSELARSNRSADRTFQGSRSFLLPPTPSSDVFLANTVTRRDDFPMLKIAVAEFFACCERGRSFGDTWMGLVAGSIPSSDVDWKQVFKTIDHRRLASFGVVHGLIRRIHRFPRLLQQQESDNSSFHSDPSFALAPPQPSLGHTSSNSSLSLRSQLRTTSGSSTNRKRQTISDITAIGSKMDGRHCDDELACEYERSLDEMLEFVGGNVAIILAASELYGQS